MTTEEKTSRYDEAIYNNYKSFTVLIERLESVKNAIKEHNYGIAMDILYKPYPNFQVTTHSELKESEDERIRQWLIEMVDEVRKANPTNAEHNGMCSKAIAWIEKQANHANFRNNIQIGDKVTRNRDGVLVNLSQLNRVAKKYEKQDEQKPAWSEEDDIMVHDIDYALRCQITYSKSRLNSMSSWIYELKNRVQPQPRQEWSKEDKETLDYIIAYIEKNKNKDTIYTKRTEILEDMLDWLKSLRPQKQ